MAFVNAEKIEQKPRTAAPYVLLVIVAATAACLSYLISVAPKPVNEPSYLYSVQQARCDWFFAKGHHERIATKAQQDEAIKICVEAAKNKVLAGEK